MPSALHEGPILLLRERPDLLLSLLGRSVHGRLHVENADFSIPVPIERRADLVVSHFEDGEPVGAFVVEVQLDIDEEKWFTWPFYLASLHTRLRCPTHLVVVTPFESVARWARQPILTMQPSSPITPIVIGPQDIPSSWSDEEAEGFPELVVLSALVHGPNSGGREIVRRAVRVVVQLTQLDELRGRTYFELIYAIVGDEARIALESFMNRGQEEEGAFVRICREFGHRMGFHEGLEEGREKGREEGREKGREEEARRAIFAVLGARRIVPSSAVRARIEGCSDITSLERWIARAAVATSSDDVCDD